jgi:hypothetical protein
MKYAWFLICTNVMIITFLTWQAVVRSNTRSGRVDFQASCAESNTLLTSGHTWDALLRVKRWLKERADYPVETDNKGMAHVINQVYGIDFPSPVPA